MSELKLEKCSYSFEESEYEGHHFMALKKITKAFRQGEKPKVQIVTVSLNNLATFKEWVRSL